MPATQPFPRLLHLRDGGTSAVVSIPETGGARILHWGADLGEVSEDVLAQLATAAQPQVVSGALDVPIQLSLVPLQSEGWQQQPGLEGYRDGAGFSPAFTVIEVSSQEASTRTSARITAVDELLELQLSSEVRLTEHGVLSVQHTLRNTGNTPFHLHRLGVALPLPASATEVLDATGRHLKERSPQRRPLTVGAHARQLRRGKPGAESPLLLSAGEPGFGFRSGRVHGIHLAFSSNAELRAELTQEGVKLLSAAELLLPGEMVLAPGQEYSTPPVPGSWGDGLDQLAGRFHEDLRSRPHHPRTPRPVTLNSWEAVYFNHDLHRLRELARTAATLGVERFVLDDGWFGARRDDRAGLGDWQVSSEVWPEGLGPLVETVTGLGMEFGLWVEPEMVNFDSDLARAHPEWILQAGAGERTRLPVAGRHQQVLNLAIPGAWDYVFSALSSLVSEYGISYFKWDHNRDLTEAGDARTGAPAAHANVLAVYRLMAALKEAHPGLEIESCSSGGARVDLGILEHTDRIWPSDCIDPLERLDIHAYTGLLVPYELMGAHVGAPVSHTTRRSHSLDFRAASALLGHFGIEWDVNSASITELERLAWWIRLYKEHRELIHTGVSVHADLPDASADLRGVMAHDGAAGLFVYTQRAASLTYPGLPMVFPGLEPGETYRVELLTPLTEENCAARSTLAWAQAPVTLPSGYLSGTGLPAPVLYPESGVVIRLQRA